MRKGQRLETLLDTYVLGEQLGQGGAGRVFAATDGQGQPVAIKVLEAIGKDKLNRFRNEVGFGLRLHHPRILLIRDQGKVPDEARYFYVMPRYDSTLRHLQKNGIPHGQALEFFAQVLDGAEAAHLKKVWHRDLKPENILYSQESGLVVADFGIAHFNEDLMQTAVATKSDDRLFAFRYAAPEQLAGKPTDQRADIYALGLILHELFTGEVIGGPGYAPIGTTAPDYAFLDPIVFRMVNHDPGGRFQSINAVKEALLANRLDFVSRQRIDALRNTVVPVATAGDDLLIADPIRVVAKDYSGGALELTLNRAPTPAWLQAYENMPNLSYTNLLHPKQIVFRGLTVRVPTDEHNVKTHLGMFQSWLANTNLEYKNRREREQKQAEEAKIRQLAEKLREEEARQRILDKLKE